MTMSGLGCVQKHEVNSISYCVCFGRCGACSGEIDGEFIRNNRKHYHKGCVSSILTHEKCMVRMLHQAQEVWSTLTVKHLVVVFPDAIGFPH